MLFSGMLHRVALVRSDVLEEYIAAIIRVTRVDELSTLRRKTANALPSPPILVAFRNVSSYESHTA
jgi:hypothetical protein